MNDENFSQKSKWKEQKIWGIYISCIFTYLNFTVGPSVSPATPVLCWIIQIK